MNDLIASAGSAQIPSSIHLEFIRSVIDSGEEGGVDNVEGFHRALFLHQHGADLERLRLERQTSEERLAALEPRLQQTQRNLATQERYVPAIEDGIPDDQPTAPWNLWDRLMFTIAALSVLCLLVFGVLNVSFNLLESGIVTFSQNPVRAYLWAALLPVGALVVKVGWDLLRSRRARAIYLWTCLTAGLIAVLVWVTAYASVYPSLSRTTEEQIAALSVFSDATPADDSFWGTTAGGVKRLDMILVAAQAIAEICLSAALGIYMTQVYQRHRPVRLAANPTFAQLDEDRRLLEQEVTRERRALASALGQQCRLEQQLSVFVAYARSLYQREIAARQDRTHQKRRLIEEMADQLRTRLADIDRIGNAPEPNGASYAASAGQNGGSR
jgi:hypothetical protein